jgi:hypothetical protein
MRGSVRREREREREREEADDGTRTHDLLHGKGAALFAVGRHL